MEDVNTHVDDLLDEIKKSLKNTSLLFCEIYMIELYSKGDFVNIKRMSEDEMIDLITTRFLPINNNVILLAILMQHCKRLDDKRQLELEKILSNNIRSLVSIYSIGRNIGSNTNRIYEDGSMRISMPQTSTEQIQNLIYGTSITTTSNICTSSNTVSTPITISNTRKPNKRSKKSKTKVSTDRTNEFSPLKNSPVKSKKNISVRRRRNK